MSETKFIPYEPEQDYLLPPRLNEWLPQDHLVYFVADVVKQMDLSEFFKDYDGSEGGRPAYSPFMMVSLLLYAYCVGVFSSRRIERATYESVPFRVISADQHPDHDTIASFRKRHLKRMEGLFTEVLRLCREAGLVKLGHIALDGTKVHANASKHKAMSYQRIVKKERELEWQIERLFEAAEKVDAEEDAEYGVGVRGDELPEELRFKRLRLERIREAKAALEQRAREKAEREEQEKGGRPKGGGNRGGRGKVKDMKPKPKAQYNFTDGDSRIMVDKSINSFQQSYNCQAAVDEEAQIIVAADVSNEANDKRQLVAMVDRVKEQTAGQMPKRLSADEGYFSSKQIEAVEKMIDLYIATAGRKHTDEEQLSARGRIPADASKKERMARKLRTERGKRIYGKRKEIVEPVFGQIKEARGFRQFLLRGLENVTGEWKLVCTTHNLLKLFRNGPSRSLC